MLWSTGLSNSVANVATLLDSSLCVICSLFLINKHVISYMLLVECMDGSNEALMGTIKGYQQ